jgi:hypothetical protein
MLSTSNNVNFRVQYSIFIFAHHQSINTSILGCDSLVPVIITDYFDTAIFLMIISFFSDTMKLTIIY